MTNYSQNRKNAYDNIVDKGVAVHIRRALEANYNPITETSTGSTLASFSTYAVLINYSNTRKKNTRIKHGDRQALLPAYSLGTVLEAGDILSLGNSRWKIINTKPLAPDGNEIIYQSQIRFYSFRPIASTATTGDTK